MVKPVNKLPENVVTFKTSVKMTDWDIKNYLEKIYKIEVANVQSRVMSGDLRKTTFGLTKHDDYRLADVSLPVGQKFTWPELFPKEKEKQEIDDYKATLEKVTEGRTVDPNLSNLPTWFR